MGWLSKRQELIKTNPLRDSKMRAIEKGHRQWFGACVTLHGSGNISKIWLSNQAQSSNVWLRQPCMEMSVQHAMAVLGPCKDLAYLCIFRLTHKLKHSTHIHFALCVIYRCSFLAIQPDLALDILPWGNIHRRFKRVPHNLAPNPATQPQS